MDPWMEKYFGKPRPVKKRVKEPEFWMWYIIAMIILCLIKYSLGEH